MHQRVYLHQEHRCGNWGVAYLLHLGRQLLIILSSSGNSKLPAAKHLHDNYNFHEPIIHCVFYVLLFAIDNNECTANTHNCHSDATCSNTHGSFTCTCNTGFSGNGMTCTGKLCLLVFLCYAKLKGFSCGCYNERNFISLYAQ